MRRRLRRSKHKKTMRIAVISFVSLTFLFMTGYSAFSTSLNITAKGNIINKPAAKIGGKRVFLVTSGDGLYEDTFSEGRYVYKGANPDNYIKLGSDLYRIVSKETDGTIKIIKNDSIGTIPFDTGYSTSISGVTDSNSISGTRYSSTSTDYCYQLSGADKSYAGCNVWGSKTTMLDSLGNSITKAFGEIGKNEHNLPSNEAYLNTFLNNSWYSSLSSEVQNLIVIHSFDVGPLKPVSTQNFASDLLQESVYKWRGKVALISSTDFVTASINSQCQNVYQAWQTVACKNDNFLYKSKYAWLISPFSDNKPSYLWYVRSSGNLGNSHDANTAHDIFPAFYLTSDIKLNGKGTSDDPYIPNL